MLSLRYCLTLLTVRMVILHHVHEQRNALFVDSAAGEADNKHLLNKVRLQASAWKNHHIVEPTRLSR